MAGERENATKSSAVVLIGGPHSFRLCFNTIGCTCTPYFIAICFITTFLCDLLSSSRAVWSQISTAEYRCCLHGMRMKLLLAQNRPKCIQTIRIEYNLKHSVWLAHFEHTEVQHAPNKFVPHQTNASCHLCWLLSRDVWCRKYLHLNMFIRSLFTLYQNTLHTVCVFKFI